MTIQSVFSALATSGSNNDLEADKSTPITFKFAPGSGLALPSSSGDSTKHQQGIQKFPAGINYGSQNYSAGFAVSGSADKGYLYFTDAGNNIVKVVTAPPFSSLNLKATNKEQYEKFNHMGGFQIAEGMLAVGMEEAGEDDHGSVVFLYSMPSLLGPDPTPVPLYVIEQHPQTAGAIGICPSPAGWWLVLSDYGCKNLEFVILNTSQRPANTSPFTVAGTWNSDMGITPGSVDRKWPSGDGAYQNLNLFCDSAGVLWMIGMDNDGYWRATPQPDEDWADLYQVTFTPNPSPQAKFPNTVSLTKKTKLHLKIKRNSSEDSASFLFGGGFYLNNPGSSDPGPFEVYVCSRWQSKENTANQFLTPAPK
jgi:hypothetical protein